MHKHSKFVKLGLLLAAAVGGLSLLLTITAPRALTAANLPTRLLRSSLTQRDGRWAPRSLADLFEAAAAHTSNRSDANATAAALYDELMRLGMLTVTPEGVAELDRMLEARLLRFGRGGANSTDGEVLGVADVRGIAPVACRNPHPGYLAICTKVRNQAWAMNEWLAYHALLGVEHMNILVDNLNTDNLLGVLAPWVEAGLASTRYNDSTGAHNWRVLAAMPPSHGHDSGAHDCFQRLKRNYTWVAFMDVDECIWSVLEDFRNYGGLALSYGLFGDAKQRLERRRRETAIEATNFTLGTPHSLVKSVCQSNRTLGPVKDMPHCCAYTRGNFAVDESFVPMGKHDAPWFQVSPAGWEPRKRIQLSHYQTASTEAAVQKYLRDYGFSQYRRKKGAFHLLLLLSNILRSRESAPVVPTPRTLALLRERSAAVKRVLGW
eukprot:scaffold1.g5842.t1